MSRKLASLFAAVAIAAAAIAPASADPAAKNVSVKVFYADLDLSRVAGIETLSIRLDKAVSKVCGRPHNVASLKLRAKIKACRVEMMNTAVAAIDAPLLTALRTGGKGAVVAAR